MIIDDPNFPKDSLVVVTGTWGAQAIGIVIKAIKGRDNMRVYLYKHKFSSVRKKDARIITKENDPELFI